MQQSLPVKVTIVKKRRQNSQRRVKSEYSSVTVTRVKRGSTKSAKNGEKPLVVANVDANTTADNALLSASSNKNIQRSSTATSVTRLPHSQSLKNVTAQPNETISHTQRSKHRLEPHTVLSIQDLAQTQSSSQCIFQAKEKNPFSSNSTNQLVVSSSMSIFKSNSAEVNPCSLQFSTDSWRDMHTIGKENINKNKKHSLCDKCTRRYCLAFSIVLFIIFGIAIAVPVIVVSSMKTSITTQITTTNDTTQTTTSVTTPIAASTVTITSNACTSSWTGIRMIYHCDNCGQQPTYSLLLFNYTAGANVTRITFAFRRDAGFFGIDDVSIRDAAVPGVELLLNGGFESGNFSSWNNCVQSGSTASGSVQSTSSGISYNGYTFVALSGTYYYLGGATVHSEYLSQQFASIIGRTYIFGFSYVYVGNGSLNSGDFFLSV